MLGARMVKGTGLKRETSTITLMKERKIRKHKRFLTTCAREGAGMNRKKVFIVNAGEWDMSSAEKFGTLIPLTEGRAQPIFNIEHILELMKPKLDTAEEDDYILLCGSPMLIVIATGLMLFKFGVVNVLLFDAKTREYVPRTLTETKLMIKCQ